MRDNYKPHDWLVNKKMSILIFHPARESGLACSRRRKEAERSQSRCSPPPYVGGYSVGKSG